MLTDREKNIHLTYCQNVHPAESWQQSFSAIKNNVPKIKSQISPYKKFGIGMRISETATSEINECELANFKKYLDENDLYVFTINAFPYANFSQPPVKQKVYLPNWADKKRADYTKKTANILTKILPEDEDVLGTISTVPLGYKFDETTKDVREKSAKNIFEVAKKLRDIHHETGKLIQLAIEPEPDCVLETSAELIDFFERYLNESWVRKFVGVCFDTSHQAVEFEDLAQSANDIINHEIEISKIQISSAIEFMGSEVNLKKVAEFIDPIFLHQVKIMQNDSGIISYSDLKNALGNHIENENENWRVHFHLPVFSEQVGGLGTTRNLLTGEFAEFMKSGICKQFEIETYTWGIIAEQNSNKIRDGIVREYRWVLKNIFGL